MSRSERLAVVVATHTNDPLLERCLSGVQSMLHQPDDLIFIDNGSSDKVGNWVTHRFPGTTVVRLDHNRLFCGGYNAGIALAVQRGYDFVLILNADTEVANIGFLDELLEVADRWPKAAFIGPLVYLRLEGAVQKTCLQFPRILRNMLIWLPWRIAKDYFQTQPSAESEVEFLNGVCVLCRVSALREIGLMDEAFGGYVEDADWSWRAQKKGWKSVFAPIPSIVHHEGSAGYEPYSLKTFLLKRNTVHWYLKVGCRLSAFSYALAALTLAWARMTFETTKDKRKRHRYFVDNLYRAYRGLLRGDSLGGWFGPPLDTWLGNVAADDG
jgi:N-acetylglucosaminyl-diphospho-decaprenol L-rhamnosyltransferase